MDKRFCAIQQTPAIAPYSDVLDPELAIKSAQEACRCLEDGYTAVNPAMSKRSLSDSDLITAYLWTQSLELYLYNN
jgi:hypothetical protein